MATNYVVYESTNPDVNKVQPIYREAVDSILYEYCTELDEQGAKRDLKEIIELLQEYLDKDF